MFAAFTILRLIVRLQLPVLARIKWGSWGKWWSLQLMSPLVGGCRCQDIVVLGKQNETLIKALALQHSSVLCGPAKRSNRRKRRAATMTMSWAKKHSIAGGPRMQMHIKCEQWPSGGRWAWRGCLVDSNCKRQPPARSSQRSRPVRDFPSLSFSEKISKRCATAVQCTSTLRKMRWHLKSNLFENFNRNGLRLFIIC